MAWTAPKTFVAGSVLTAAELNTHLRDNMLETAPAKASAAGGLIVTTGTNTIAQKVWTDWSPSYNDLTIGNGTVVSRFMEAGNLIVARFEWTFGSTSSVDDTSSSISLPVTASSSGYSNSASPFGTATFRDEGANTFYGIVEFASTTFVQVRVGDATGSDVASQAISSTNPMTWTTNDTLSFIIVYEAA